MLGTNLNVGNSLFDKPFFNGFDERNQEMVALFFSLRLLLIDQEFD